MRRRKADPVEAWRVTAWQCASLLIAYPDEELTERRPLLRAAARTLPPEAAAPLGRFLDHLDATPLGELAAAYVRTFDHQRRCCPYLTYYAHGDTRKRGMALLRFKQFYRRAGLVLSDDELPDHLAVVLEFAATGDPERGYRMLCEYRAGLEVLRLALHDAGSPYVDVALLVTATLPPLAVSDTEAVLRLAAEGPPAEEVGLEPFAPPEFMPTPAPAPVPAPGARR